MDSCDPERTSGVCSFGASRLAAESLESDTPPEARLVPLPMHCAPVASSSSVAPLPVQPATDPEDAGNVDTQKARRHHLAPARVSSMSE